jgi:hypothetical protein
MQMCPEHGLVSNRSLVADRSPTSDAPPVFVINLHEPSNSKSGGCMAKKGSSRHFIYAKPVLRAAGFECGEEKVEK